jgi:hypothetical protein
MNRRNFLHYRDANKSLARPTSLSIVFSVQGTGGSPTRPDPENRVGDQDIGCTGRAVSSGCKFPVSHFLAGRAKDLSAPLVYLSVTVAQYGIRSALTFVLRR